MIKILLEKETTMSVVRNNGLNSKRRKRKRSEGTCYDPEEDGDPLMLHVQKAPRPKGFKIPDLEKCDGSLGVRHLRECS